VACTQCTFNSYSPAADMNNSTRPYNNNSYGSSTTTTTTRPPMYYGSAPSNRPMNPSPSAGNRPPFRRPVAIQQQRPFAHHMQG
jgi:hypothetical protein